MDINKFKSVAVRIGDYNLLQGLCNKKFRSPASMISKLVREYVEFQAKKNNKSIDKYIKEDLDVKLTEKENGKRKNKNNN